MLCRLKTKLLWLLSVFAGLFLFCVVPCYASSGTDSINITENWNTFSDQTGWHENVNDGAVSLPHNLINVDPNFVKSISYSRFRTGSLNFGDSNNTYNTITIKITITTGSNGVSQWARDGNMLVTGYFTDSENTQVNLNNETANNCKYNTSGSQIVITCSATLSNYATLTKFDIGFGTLVIPSNTNHVFAYAINTPVKLQSITLEFHGTQDPNTALLEQQNQLLTAQNEKLDEISEDVSGIKDFLTDDTPPSVDTSSLNNSAGWLPAGPVDSIITLPVTIIQNLMTALNGSTCQALNLPLPYVNEDLVIPCMRPVLQEMGYYTIYQVVGLIIGGFLLYHTLIWLYDYVTKTLELQEKNNTWFGGD